MSINGDDDDKIIPFPGNAPEPPPIIKESELMTEVEEMYANAIDELTRAEQSEAEAFLARKHELAGKVRSDWEARAMACLDTQADVTRRRGLSEILRARLFRGTNNAAER